MRKGKRAYICGPLTELPVQDQLAVKNFYSRIADACEETTGLRAFVPHEHYDPVRSPHFTPQEVDGAERDQVCNKTSVLIVVAIAPSWGGGIGVEMARANGVPVIILRPKGKKLSRLLLGNKGVVMVIDYDNETQAFNLLKDAVSKVLQPA